MQAKQSPFQNHSMIVVNWLSLLGVLVQNIEYTESANQQGN